jgi:hypothetical protein
MPGLWYKISQFGFRIEVFSEKAKSRQERINCGIFEFWRAGSVSDRSLLREIPRPTSRIRSQFGCRLRSLTGSAAAGGSARWQAQIAAAAPGVGCYHRHAGQADQAFEVFAVTLGTLHFGVAEDDGFERVVAVLASVFVHRHGLVSPFSVNLAGPLENLLFAFSQALFALAGDFFQHGIKFGFQVLVDQIP